ncbi:MAG: PqqD family peptide modification chaperone [Planctomycetota bacterium]|nr:PqqD family peptide modification chaperone [Planctomycetota bacterium]
MTQALTRPALERDSKSDRYLSLRSGCTLVRGAKNGAIYDLSNKELYRLDVLMTQVLQMSAAGLGVGEILENAERMGRARPWMEEMIALLEELPVVEVDSKPTTSGAIPILRRKHTLDFLWIELTAVCNLQCVHCYAEAGRAPRPDEFSTADWTRVLEEAAELGCRQVQFTGGDPTIYPDLFPLILKAKDLGFSFIEIFTNALLLDDEKIRFLAENDVHVAVSFYSHDPAIHDRVTVKKGSWEQTSRSIRKLVESGISTRVGVVVMRLNEDGLEQTLEYVRSLGVKNVKVDTIRPTGRGVDPNLRPKNWANEQTSPKFGLNCCGEKLSFNSCWSGKIAVESRGKVIPCIFSRDKVAGDLSRQSLREVVTGTSMQFFWDFTLDKVEICRDCEFRFACRDCRAIAHTTHGSIYKKSPRCTYDPYTGEWGEGSARQVEELLHGMRDDCVGEEEVEMKKRSTRPAARPARREDVLSRDVDGEIVLFDPVSNGIHGLNPTASFVWDLCDGTRTEDEITGELRTVYPGSDEIPADVHRTIEEFQTMGLLER